MSVPRIFRVLRTRWLVVAAIAVVGAGAAFVAIQLRNSQLEPSFLAVAPISVLRLEGEQDGRYVRRLETALAQAEEAVAEGLADERLSIASDPTDGTIRFEA